MRCIGSIAALAAVLLLGFAGVHGWIVVARSKLALIATGGSPQASVTSSAKAGSSASTAVPGSSNTGDLDQSAAGLAERGQFAEATARGLAESGSSAEDIAIAIGLTQGGHISAEAIVEAAKAGKRNALAIFISRMVKEGKRSEAVAALIGAHTVALNHGDGTAYAHALAAGVIYGGDSTKAFTEVISILFRDGGCEKMKSTLLGMKTQAIANAELHPFVNAFASDAKVLECVFPACMDGLKQCCSSGKTMCKCDQGGCEYKLWKAEQKIWACNKNCGNAESICICI